MDSFAWIESVAHLSLHDYLCLHDYHVVCSIHTSEHSINIRTNSAFEKFNKCHFTIIMSCVESTIRKIRLSGKIGLRITFAVGQTQFFFAWIKYEIFVIFWLRHVFTITFVIIIYTKNFSNTLLSAKWMVIPARMVVACSLERIWIAQGARHKPERQNS